MPDDEQQRGEGQQGRETTEGKPASFGEAEPEEGGDNLSLDLLMDVGLPVRVEMGRARLTVRELLELRKGSIIQLDRTAGEPVNLYVRDKCFAQGEVVVAGNNFGLRITRIMEDGRRAVRRRERESEDADEVPEEAAETHNKEGEGQ